MDLTKYPSTELFMAKDVLIAPHPYCVTDRHVAVAADYHFGILNEGTIKDAEKKGARCGVRGCVLSYDKHEKVLVIQVASDKQLQDVPGLQDYLLSIKDMATKDGYVGFAFYQKK